MYIVYKLTSPSGKNYIGYTSKTIEKRINVHCNDRQCLINKNNQLPRFYAAWNKYPIDQWVREILHTVSSKKEAQQLEKYEIQNRNSLDESFGYNMANGGDGGDTGRNGEKWKREEHSKFLRQQYKNEPHRKQIISEQAKERQQKLKLNKEAYNNYCNNISLRTPRGEEHWNHTGWWVVNHNTYTTLKDAIKNENFSESSIILHCNNPDKIIKIVSAKQKENKNCTLRVGYINRECGYYRIQEKQNG
jgi:hypothetical protein